VNTKHNAHNKKLVLFNHNIRVKAVETSYRPENNQILQRFQTEDMNIGKQATSKQVTQTTKS
jgi:hypothetical protein